MSKRRQRARSPQPHWAPLLDERAALWRDLGDDEQRLMLERIAGFVHGRRWEGIDVDVDEAMKLIIAAHACLLGLGFDRDPFHDVSSVVVYPTTVVRRGVRNLGGGLSASGPLAIHGETVRGGPVVVVWRAVDAGSRHPERGRHVVIHEFAHQLDLIDGVVDGMPLLSGRAAELSWQRMIDEVMAALIAEVDPLLGRYATTNRGELFAVASERFFTRPHELRVRFPDFYAGLVAFYRQDPRRRRPPSPP